jgi:hypothetical protein
MNVEKLTMDPEQARTQLEGYAAVLRRTWDDEYARVVRGLEAMAEGEAVFSLGDAVRGAGLDEQGRPRLAIARADRKTVHWTQWGGDTFGAFDARSPAATGHSDTLQVHVDLGVFGEHRTVRGWALVPMVPPAGVRKIGGMSILREHFVLWEVEEWSDTRIGAAPDRDPYLVRRLGGDLYAVVHEWDLTPLERAVMAGRARD